jgi:benzoyl-CoA reductase/2-hydroxyglutaryl-CoA dehydratase subunit BcrC/BadD/HgdB
MKIALTTTVPLEPILAAGHTPVDLNNIFITNPKPQAYVDRAHSAGFPRSLCSWIKAQYTIMTEGTFDAIIAVDTGDCSNTNAMMEILQDAGILVHHFSYPPSKKLKDMQEELNSLCDFLGTDMSAAQETFHKLEALRQKLHKLDEMTVSGYVTGLENHTWLVSSSDFCSDAVLFEKNLDAFLAEASTREAHKPAVRLGYVGVPPIITNLHSHVSSLGAEFVFNEVQRQFSIPSRAEDMAGRYLDYSYPYDVFGRIADIRRAVEERQLDGIVHYVQSFCHRQVQDILLRKHLNVPVLTIEADSPSTLDERSKIRLESFVEMIGSRKGL